MSIRRLSIQYLKSNYKLIVASFACMFVVSAFHAFLLFLLGPFLSLLFGGETTLAGTGLMDRVNSWVLGTDPLKIAVGLPVVLICLKSISAYSQYLYKYLQSCLFIGYVQKFREWLFTKILDLPMDDARTKVASEWTSLVMHEVDYLKGRVLGLVQGMSKDAAALLGCSVVIALSLQPVLHLVVVYVLVLILLFFSAGWILSSHANRYQKHIARMVELTENFRQRCLYIRAEGAEMREASALLAESSAFYQERKRVLWVATLMPPALELSVILMISLLCYFFWNSSISVSSSAFISGLGAFATALKPIRSLGQNSASLFEVFGVVQDKWVELVTTPTSESFLRSSSKTKKDTHIAQGSGPLPFELGSFPFSAGRSSIDTPSICFKPGELQVVVGQSGAGKTSFIRSLVGLDKTRAQAADLGMFAYVAQRPFLLDGTIGENINYGSSQSVTENFAGLKSKPEWLRWDRNIDGLSGGQQYVVTFLRGYFSGRPVLVLDEPFASLDPSLESWVFSLITKCLSEGRSVFFSTHRFDMLRTDDRIWEIGSGEMTSVSLTDVLESYRPC